MCGFLSCPLLGTWPATQACALTGTLTSDPLVHRLVFNPLSHTSQGRKKILMSHKIWNICSVELVTREMQIIKPTKRHLFIPNGLTKIIKAHNIKCGWRYVVKEIFIVIQVGIAMLWNYLVLPSKSEHVLSLEANNSTPGNILKKLLHVSPES